MINPLLTQKKRVVNIRKDRCDVVCGRPSKWGNPFEIGKDGDRDEVTQKHEDWLLVGEGQYLLKDLHELKGRTLGCWCKPKKCHCDLLVWLSDNLDEAEKLVTLTLGNMAMENDVLDEEDRAKLLAKCFILLREKEKYCGHEQVSVLS